MVSASLAQRPQEGTRRTRAGHSVARDSRMTPRGQEEDTGFASVDDKRTRSGDRLAAAAKRKTKAG